MGKRWIGAAISGFGPGGLEPVFFDFVESGEPLLASNLLGSQAVLASGGNPSIFRTSNRANQILVILRPN